MVTTSLGMGVRRSVLGALGSRDQSPAPAIVACDLSKSFGVVEAVRDVSFEVPRGEVFALLGSLGAGKSTIIRMLCALTEPTGGRAEVAGYDVVERPRTVRRRVGLVTGSEVTGRPAPEVVFFDEPAPAPDDLPAGADLGSVMRRIRDLGATVVFATSSVEDADEADRIAIVDQGRIAAVGTPAALKAAVPARRAGEEPATLDDAFFHFTGGPIRPHGEELGAARRFIAGQRH
ncbi:MAG: ATP-binding cassette domain-containing protein [Acidimicrobiia bacterium]